MKHHVKKSIIEIKYRNEKEAVKVQKWECRKCGREIEVLAAVDVICCGHHASRVGHAEKKPAEKQVKKQPGQQQLSLFSA